MTHEYKKAGVDIDAGNRFVETIKPFIKATHRRGVMGGIGGFGALFALDIAEIKEPVLVSGTDGVGTKLKIAIEMNQLDTIGQDLVAMCVNDIACSGAEPLFFLDYFATPQLQPEKHAEIVKGIASACREVKCALIGGETAEMPDLYAPGDFDLAGFAVGIVEKSKIIDGSEIGIGNAIIGIASSGLHSNGYSLARRVLRDATLSLSKTYEGFPQTLGEMLLTPTKLYSPLLGSLKRTFSLRGIAHITGGGLRENIPRILPSQVRATIHRKNWRIPPLFTLFQHKGKIDDNEMLRVFNCGVGLILIVPPENANDVVETIQSQGEEAFILGSIEERQKESEAVVII